MDFIRRILKNANVGITTGDWLCAGLLVLLAIVTRISWFTFGTVISYADAWYLFSERIHEAFGSYIWAGGSNFGSPNIEAYKDTFYLLWGVLADMGFQYSDILRITHLLPIAILGYLAPYVLARYLTASRLVAVTGAIFYGSTTPFIMRGQLGHLSVAFVIALAPLIIYLMMRATKDNSWSRWLIFVMIYWLGTCYEARIMYIVTGVLGLYFAVFCLPNVRMHVYKLLIAAALFTLLSLYWVFPILIGNFSSAIDSTASRELFGNGLQSLMMSLTDFYHGWTGSFPLNFEPQSIPMYFWLMPIVCVALHVFGRSKKERLIALFFASIYLIGIFLTKQVDDPFPLVFQWLRVHLPGFIVFRSGSKFFFLISLGCLGILSLGLDSLKKRFNSGWRRVTWLFACFAVIILSFANLRPLLTNEIGGMYVSNEMPADYTVLRDFLNAQADKFTRTLWIPSDSRWSYYLDNKPKVSYSQVLYSTWSKIIPAVDLYGNRYRSWESMINGLSTEFSNQLLDLSSIRYVVVPISDVSNNDEFFQYYGGDRDYFIKNIDKIPYLKKLDIGTKDLVIYENKEYMSNVFVSDRLYSVGPAASLAKGSKVAAGVFGDKYLFSVSDEDKDDSMLTYLSNPFDIYSLNQRNNNLVISSDVYARRGGRLMWNTASNDIFAHASFDVLSIYRQRNGLLDINGVSAGYQDHSEVEPVAKIHVPQGGMPYVSSNALIKKVEDGLTVGLGQAARRVEMNVALTKKNIIPNASFENGSWQNTVGDCHNRDNNAKLAMSINKQEKTDGNQSLQLEATRHTACVVVKVPLKHAGDYAFSLDFQGQNSKKAGYYISFNDSDKTHIDSKLPIADGEWSSVTRRVSVPDGATLAKIYLYAYESDGLVNNIVRYDNVYFAEIGKTVEVPLATVEKYELISAHLAKGANILEYRDDRYAYSNLLLNSSFEKGAWTMAVGDCHNYDKKPLLAMSLNEELRTDGRRSLQLEATRHNACINTSTAVNGGSTYFLSFDYQSPTKSSAEYYIGYNDEIKTKNDEELPVSDNEWHSFSKTIRVPDEATSLSLYIYANESDGYTNNIVRYDNFKLIEVPDLSDAYYLVSEPERKLVEPKAVDFELVNPTKKIVHAKGAATPFFLAMSESYHDKWQLQLDNSKIHGFLNGWGPWAKPDRVGDEYHYKLDGFLNAWYVDTDAWCAAGANPACRRNADGSWDMDLVIEFWPQRWFYLGLLISGTTLAGCLGYLGWVGVKSLRRRYAKK